MPIRQFLLKKKPVSMMLCLKDNSKTWYPSKLARESGTSYVYVSNWLSELSKSGWVKIETIGRKKKAVLTEQGMAVAVSLDELVRKMEIRPPEHKEQSIEQQQQEKKQEMKINQKEK